MTPSFDPPKTSVEKNRGDTVAPLQRAAFGQPPGDPSVPSDPWRPTRQPKTAKHGGM
jgi:hypothetical protein